MESNRIKWNKNSIQRETKNKIQLYNIKKFAYFSDFYAYSHFIGMLTLSIARWHNVRKKFSIVKQINQYMNDRHPCVAGNSFCYDTDLYSILQFNNGTFWKLKLFHTTKIILIAVRCFRFNKRARWLLFFFWQLSHRSFLPLLLILYGTFSYIKHTIRITLLS